MKLAILFYYFFTLLPLAFQTCSSFLRRRRSGREALRASPRCRRGLDIPPSTPQKTGNASVIVENGKWFSREGKREGVRNVMGEM